MRLVVSHYFAELRELQSQGLLVFLFVGWLASSAFSVWTLGLTPLLEGKRRDTECCTLGSARHSVCWPLASYLRIFTGKRYEFHNIHIYIYSYVSWCELEIMALFMAAHNLTIHGILIDLPNRMLLWELLEDRLA